MLKKEKSQTKWSNGIANGYNMAQIHWPQKLDVFFENQPMLWVPWSKRMSLVNYWSTSWGGKQNQVGPCNNCGDMRNVGNQRITLPSGDALYNPFMLVLGMMCWVLAHSLPSVTNDQGNFLEVACVVGWLAAAAALSTEDIDVGVDASAFLHLVTAMFNSILDLRRICQNCSLPQNRMDLKSTFYKFDDSLGLRVCPHPDPLATSSHGFGPEHRSIRRPRWLARYLKCHTIVRT